MAQLYYRYGTMNSGKTIEILKVAYNYEEQGKGVVIMTSALDTRDGQQLGNHLQQLELNDLSNQSIQP
ncbi:hypothetical protein JQN32_26355 [Escherichia coli]|nr:hypothetical protein [Escherichia coli]